LVLLALQVQLRLEDLLVEMVEDVKIVKLEKAVKQATQESESMLARCNAK
jgi:hypothetical protein